VVSSRQQRRWRRAKLTAGLAVVALVCLLGVLAPLIAPADPLRQNLAFQLRPPMSVEPGHGLHVLGTDHLGRDILSRLMFGARISLLISLSAVLLSGVLGTAVGLVGGFRGGPVDDILMRVADVQMACPFILLALAVAAILRPTVQNTVIVLAVTGWVVYARVVRSRVLLVRETEFVQAARALGASSGRLMFRHVLPNVVSTCVVIASTEAARMIILESALTFLALGVQPPTPSWGGMLTDGKVYFSSAWWLTTFPGLAILVTVLGINLLGDGLRDLLDPKLKI
jgi:peptide/nickel transport system permease protein